MPSSKPKIQAYVSDRLYQAVQEWKATSGITGDSEAIERLLSAALDLPSDRDVPGEVLQEIYQRLNALDDRLATLEGLMGNELVNNKLPHTITPTGDGISQNELARLCKCNDRKLKVVRDRPEELAEFTLKRIGQAYDFRDGRYYPLSH